MSFLIRNTLVFSIAISLLATANVNGQRVTRVIKLQNQSQTTAVQSTATKVPDILSNLADPTKMASEEIRPDAAPRIAQRPDNITSFVPAANPPASGFQQTAPQVQTITPPNQTPATLDGLQSPYGLQSAIPQSPKIHSVITHRDAIHGQQHWNQNGFQSVQPTYQQFQQIPTQQVAARTTSVQSSPMITTEILAPKFVNIGRKATIQIKLANTGVSNANGIKLVAELPKNARFVSANPQPISTEGQQLTFDINEIQARRSSLVQIELIPTAKEAFDIETQVILENRQKVAVSVREPTLKLNIDGPTDTILGKWNKHKVTITNTGDGIAENIRLNPILPAEVRSSIEPRAIRFLQPGQSTIVDVSTYCERPGQYQMEYQIESIGVQQNSITRPLRVFQPEIHIAAQGPNVTFVKHSGLYAVTVENVGEIAVNDVEVLLSLPPGIRITTVSKQASVHPQTGQLIWKFDSIPAQGSQLIQMKGLALTTGDQVCRIMVRSAETEGKEIRLKTQVDSRADVKIGITNPGGPVRAGTKTKFSIEVENRGSGIAKRVRVHAELPTSTMPIAGSNYQVNEIGNAIHFPAIDLMPGEKRTLEFQAVGVDQGEHVIRGVLQLGETQRRIIAEDSIFVFETDESKITEALKTEFRR